MLIIKKIYLWIFLSSNSGDVYVELEKSGINKLNAKVQNSTHCGLKRIICALE